MLYFRHILNRSKTEALNKINDEIESEGYQYTEIDYNNKEHFRETLKHFIDNVTFVFKYSVNINFSLSKINTIRQIYYDFVDEIVINEDNENKDWLDIYNKKYKKNYSVEDFLDFIAEKIFVDVYKNKERVISKRTNVYTYNLGGFISCL